MTKKTRNMTLSALFSALSVIALFLVSLWPTGQLGFAAVSSLFVAAAVIEMGVAPGICVFAISAAISLLVVPDRSATLLYILFFGYYPIVKHLTERTGRALLRWVTRLAIFNASLTVILLFLRELFISFSIDTVAIILLYLCGNAVFIVFDHGYSKLIRYYICHVSKHLKGR